MNFVTTEYNCISNIAVVLVIFHQFLLNHHFVRMELSINKLNSPQNQMKNFLNYSILKGRWSEWYGQGHAHRYDIIFLKLNPFLKLPTRNNVIFLLGPFSVTTVSKILTK